MTAPSTTCGACGKAFRLPVPVCQRPGCSAFDDSVCYVCGAALAATGARSRRGFCSESCLREGMRSAHDDIREQADQIIVERGVDPAMVRGRRARDPSRPCMVCLASGERAGERCPTCGGHGLLGRYPVCRCEVACDPFKAPEQLCEAASAWRAVVTGEVADAGPLRMRRLRAVLLGVEGEGPGASADWRAVAELARLHGVEVTVWPLNRHTLAVDVWPLWDRAVTLAGYLDELLDMHGARTVAGAELGERSRLEAAVRLVVEDWVTNQKGAP